MSKPQGITSGAALRLQEVRFNASSGSLTAELLQEAYDRIIKGDSMAGFGCDNKDLSVKKVKNGYIISVGYDQYVFRTLAQVNKAIIEYFTQQVQKEEET